MNYENSRPIGGEVYDSGNNTRYGNKDNSTVFMTFEELQKTWISKKKRERL